VLHHPNLPFMAHGGLFDLLLSGRLHFLGLSSSFLTAWRMGCFSLSLIGACFLYGGHAFSEFWGVSVSDQRRKDEKNFDRYE
jgi:hypothetical protein